jgi:hypothetical protein
MFRNFVFTLALVAATVAPAATLKGTVTSEPEGAPVPRAHIFVLQSGKHAELAAETDDRGKFNIEVEPGFYNVFITAVGFSPTCTKIEVTARKPAVYNPRLKINRIESSETHK